MRWPLTLRLELAAPASEPWQLFCDHGRGFVEDDSAREIVVPADGSQWAASLAVGPRRVARVRLDPPGETGPWRVGRVCAQNPVGRRACLPGVALAAAVARLHDLAPLAADGDALVLRPTGEDPWIVWEQGAGLPHLLADVGIPSPGEALAFVGGAALGWVGWLAAARRLATTAVARHWRWAMWTLLAGTALTESALIVAGEALLPSPYLYDRDLGFRRRPRFEGSNEFGFNDRDYPHERVPGVPRVLLLSDSFNWVGGLEGNPSALLERELTRRSASGPVEVIAAGYPMTHTQQQLVLLGKYGLTYRPDLVLLGLCTGNDLYDAQPFVQRIVVDDLLLDVDVRDPLRLVFGRPLPRRPRLLLFLEQNLKLARETTVSERGTELAEPAWARVERGRIRFYFPDLHARGLFRSQVQMTKDAIRRMRQLAQGRGAELAVVLYPAEFSVDPSVVERLLAPVPGPRPRFDPRLAQDLLAGFLGDEHIPSLDLQPAFVREARAGERLYLRNDGHFSPAGARLASRAMAPFVERLLRRERAEGRGASPAEGAARAGR